MGENSRSQPLNRRVDELLTDSDRDDFPHHSLAVAVEVRQAQKNGEGGLNMRDEVREALREATQQA
jgi:hypothetical protein